MLRAEKKQKECLATLQTLLENAIPHGSIFPFQWPDGPLFYELSAGKEQAVFEPPQTG